MSGAEPPRGEGAIKSVQRALDLLDALAVADELSVSELSRQTGLDKSTVSRQLASLESRRLVLRNPNSQKFSLGFKLLELGNRVAARYELASVAEAAMRRLRDETDETISLHLRVGPTDRVCIAQFESRAGVRRTWRIGEVLSLLPGAGGKCLLAFMAPTERTGALTRAVAAARERGYVIDETALQAELDAGRRCGYLASREERVPGGSGLSFPLRSAGGTQVGALSLSSLVDRLTGEHRERCVEAGLRQAAAIERLLGYERVDGR